MLPEFIPYYSVGPFFGFATNSVMAILCLVILALYHHYRPLRSLFLFYLFSTFLFLGWVIYGLQKSPESILLGYRIDLAALVLLPVSWIWFISALFSERLGWLPRMSEGIELFKAGRLDDALSNFQEAQLIFPQDLPLRLLVTSLRNALEQGQPVKGAALLDFRSK